MRIIVNRTRTRALIILSSGRQFWLSHDTDVMLLIRDLYARELAQDEVTQVNVSLSDAA